MYTSYEIAENYLGAGEKKVRMTWMALLLSGILSGMFIALAGAASTAGSIAVSGANSDGVGKLISALLFPGGLAMVILCGTELFTGNSLLVIPLIQGRIRIPEMLRNWVLVYLGNLLGSVLVALLVTGGHLPSMFSGVFGEVILATAEKKVGLSLQDALCRGILCNFLVCVAVWCSMSAKTTGGKLAGLYFPIMLFVISGFEHSIANMYYLSAGLFTKAAYPELAQLAPGLSLGSALMANLLPVTLGNIIGGMGLGAVLSCIYLKKH